MAMAKWLVIIVALIVIATVGGFLLRENVTLFGFDAGRIIRERGDELEDQIRDLKRGIDIAKGWAEIDRQRVDADADRARRYQAALEEYRIRVGILEERSARIEAAAASAREGADRASAGVGSAKEGIAGALGSVDRIEEIIGEIEDGLFGVQDNG